MWPPDPLVNAIAAFRSPPPAPPNAKAKLPGPPARTLKRRKPGWRPGQLQPLASFRLVPVPPLGPGGFSGRPVPIRPVREEAPDGPDATVTQEERRRQED